MLRCVALLVAVLLVVPSVPAQTLAHPGWRGNGIAPQLWWKHASFVRFGPGVTFAEATHSLDAMAGAGIDSMILPDLQPAAGDPLPFNPRFGTQDDLDELLRETSARHMHVLLTIPMARLSAGDAEVRFWMSRGIAGLDVGTVSAGDLAVLRGVRSAMAQFAGERILIGSVAEAAAATRADLRRDPLTLHVVAAAAGAGPQWRAREVSTLDAAAAGTGNMALIFPADLLQQPGASLKIRALLAARTQRPPRRR